MGTAVPFPIISLVGLAFSLLSAFSASTSVNMFPVQGPLAQVQPRPELVARAEGIQGNTGNFLLDMPDGVHCKGRWSSVAPTFSASGNQTLFTKYGAITGSSTISGNLPGVNRGQAFANCSDGRALNAEFLTGSGTANGYGVAEDTQGNVYKMIF